MPRTAPRLNPGGLRAPKQEVRETLAQGGNAFRSAAVDPGRQYGWTMDELAKLIKQALSDLDGPFIASRMEGITELVRQTQGVCNRTLWRLPHRQLRTFDGHGRHGY
jgi:hypothetical protein